MHDTCAVRNGVRRVDELGFFAGELTGIEKKEQRGQAADQNEHPIDQRLAGLRSYESQYRLALVKAGAVHD